MKINKNSDLIIPKCSDILSEKYMDSNMVMYRRKFIKKILNMKSWNNMKLYSKYTSELFFKTKEYNEM
jgi:hypothetical protein